MRYLVRLYRSLDLRYVVRGYRISADPCSQRYKISVQVFHTTVSFFSWEDCDNLEFSENRFSTAKCVFEHLGRNVWGYFALGLSLNRIAPVCLINLKYKAWISCKFSHSSFHVSLKNVTHFLSKKIFFDVFN